ncbi:hypothetical protein [Delftia acidovorans]|uniref:Uncharacterized protein n=1 Tax=Delftia acidovorans TaxID=80866 RepID=A0AAJ2R334_DELAC|nr:hypothetical protein [Delftia acidovorans]MDX4957259.1 hypothetical protein [Delftia acidovorans]
MMFSTWLDAEKGRAKAASKHFNRSKAAISQWRAGVPLDLMLKVRDYTGNEVTLEEMLQERTAAAQQPTSR